MINGGILDNFDERILSLIKVESKPKQIRKDTTDVINIFYWYKRMLNLNKQKPISTQKKTQ